MCKDNTTGAAATWRGPRNRKLGEKSNPYVRTTIYGVQLKFDKIRKEDAGTYTCKTHMEKAEFTLFVEEKQDRSVDYPDTELPVETYTKPNNYKYTPNNYQPKPFFFPTHAPTTAEPIEFVDTPLEQQGEEGTDIIIKCEAKRASISWLVDGELPREPKYQIIGDGLLVKNATKNDAKTYICKAFGEITGTFVDKPINLTVTHGPRLPANTPERHYMKEEIVYGYIGGVVNLTCEVEAEPPPTFRWFDKSNRKKIGEEIRGVNPYQSVLMLKMTWKTIGDYMCRAENQYGTLEVIFKVLNGSQPNPPTSLRLKEASSTSLTLEIDGPEPTEEEIESHMTPVGYRVEYRPLNDSDSDSGEWMAESFALTEDKSYTLTELVHTTQYEVRAATENPAGLSDFTNTTTFKTEPSAAVTINTNILSISIVSFNLLLLVTNGLSHSHI